MCMFVRGCVLWLNSKFGKVWRSYNVYELCFMSFIPLYLSIYIYIYTYLFIYLLTYIYFTNVNYLHSPPFIQLILYSPTHSPSYCQACYDLNDVVRSFASASVRMWNPLEHRLYMSNTLLITVTDKNYRRKMRRKLPVVLVRARKIFYQCMNRFRASGSFLDCTKIRRQHVLRKGGTRLVLL